MKLDKVRQALAEQKNKETLPSGDELANLYATSKTLGTLIDRIGKPHVSPEELKDAVDSLKGGIKTLSSDLRDVLDSLKAEVTQRPTSFDPVLKAVQLLERGVTSMTQAISSIRIPEPPPLPPQKDVDLTPVLTSQDNIVALIAGLQREEREEEDEEHEPRSWTFDVKRNNSGLIRKVEVNEA